MKKRILAWTALVIFVLILINLMFIHYHVTESLMICILYALFFFFYGKREENRNYNVFGDDGDSPGKTGESDENEHGSPE